MYIYNSLNGVCLCIGVVDANSRGVERFPESVGFVSGRKSWETNAECINEYSIKCVGTVVDRSFDISVHCRLFIDYRYSTDTRIPCRGICGSIVALTPVVGPVP